MFRTTPKFGLGGLEGGELWLGHGAKCSLCVGDQYGEVVGLRGRGTPGRPVAATPDSLPITYT